MTHGGKREGAGRKPSPHGETKTIRVPVAVLPEILSIIEKFKKALHNSKF